jgi:hypothetical protein
MRLRQGDDWQIQVSVVGPDGLPYDLSTLLNLYATIGAGPALVFSGTLLTGEISIVGPPANGVFDVAVPRSKTTGIEASCEYRIQCRAQLSDGTIDSIGSGLIWVTPQLKAVP